MSGRVVETGRIRVDARRALDKMRDHLLADPHEYAREIARAAVASGAARVEIAYDADDVFIAWDGEPLPEDALPRIFEHLFDEGGEERGGGEEEARVYALRALSLGVNAALGLGARFVDLYAAPPGREAARVRWTAAWLGDPEGLPSVERGLPPARAFGLPSCAHVRRPLGASVLVRALSREAPPELRLLEEATRDLPIPVRAGGKSLAPPDRPAATPVLRLPLELAGCRRAFLEILDPDDAGGRLHFLERGVELWAAPFGSPWAPTEAIPARAVFDAQRLETNASRSALREGSALLGRAREAALSALDLACELLAAACRGEALAGELEDSGAELTADAERLERAAGALAHLAGAALRRGGRISLGASELLDLPLLRDGAGVLRPARWLVARPEAPLRLLRGSSPLPEALSPWLSDVLWIRGNPAERLAAAFPLVDAAGLVELARAGLARRKAHLSRPASGPALAPGPGPRAHLEAGEGELAGLRGEVVLRVDREPGSPSVARVFVEERQLDAISVGAEVSPLPFEAALAWPGRILPRFAYDGVEPGPALSLALARAVLSAAALAGARLTELATRAPGDPELERSRRFARAAIGACALAPRALGAWPGEPEVASVALLRDALVWPTTDRGRRLSLRRLEEEAARRGVIRHAPPGSEGRAVDGGPVLACDDAELRWLGAALGAALGEEAGRLTLVPYGAALGRRTRPEDLASALDAVAPPDAPRVPLALGGSTALAALGAEPLLCLVHAGVRLSVLPLSPILGPLALALDDPSVLPAPGWDAALGWDPRRLAALERAACLALASSPETPAAVRRDGRLRAYALASLAKLSAAAHRTGADDELFGRLGALPLFAVAGGDEAREAREPELLSLEALSILHPAPAPVPLISARPSFPFGEWRPLVAELPSEREALAAIFGGRLRPSDGELSARARAAEAAQRLQALRARPRLDPSGAPASADPSSPVAVVPVGGPGEGVAAVALARAGGEGRLPIELLFEEHPLDLDFALEPPRPEAALPVAARVSLVEPTHLDGLSGPSAAGFEAIRRAVRAGATRLALDLAAAAQSPAAAPALFESPVALALLVAVLPVTPSLVEALRHPSLRWPVVHGEDAPLAALEGPPGKVRAGSRRHPAWRPAVHGPSELDGPILAVEGPAGTGIARLLEALGLTLVDVTERLDELQARRASGALPPSPRLPGAPSHPALRASLAELGVRGAGEIELLPGPGSTVQLVGADGRTRSVDLELPLPVRLVALVEGDVFADDAAPARRAVVSAALEGLSCRLRGLAPRLGELPPFARAALRAVVLAHLRERGAVEPGDEDLELLPDVRGGLRSLREIAGRPGWPATLDPPPYPARAARGEDRPALALSREEFDLLAGKLRVRNATMALRTALLGEARAAAPPRAVVALDPEARRDSAFVGPVRVEGENGNADPGLEGEVGILAPAAAGWARPLEVLSRRRPLCALEPGEGWPLVAVLSDARGAPNVAFDGFDDPDHAARIVAEVRRAAASALRVSIAPPADALAVRWLDGGGAGVELRAGQRVLGALWLPATYPRAPRVKILGPDQASATREPLVLPAPPRHLDGVLPVEGFLLVLPAPGADPAAARRDLALEALALASDMLAEASARAPDAPALAAYAWHLALFGRFLRSKDAPRVEPPPARAAVGGEVSLAAVFREIFRRQRLWWTRREGQASGAFPGAPPGFVLLDDGASPLLEVLRLRSPGSLLRELGGAPARAPAAAAPPAAIESFEPPGPPEPPEPDGFFGGALRRLKGLLEDDPPEAPGLRPVRGETVAFPATDDPAGIGDALLAALRRLELTGDPVGIVARVPGGAGLRYVPGERRLELGAAHPLSEGVAAGDPDALALLAAEAVGELNRALEGIPDAEERRALLALLRSP